MFHRGRKYYKKKKRRKKEFAVTKQRNVITVNLKVNTHFTFALSVHIHLTISMCSNLNYRTLLQTYC